MKAILSEEGCSRESGINSRPLISSPTPTRQRACLISLPSIFETIAMFQRVNIIVFSVIQYIKDIRVYKGVVLHR